jgi:hypothetical protein
MPGVMSDAPDRKTCFPDLSMNRAHMNGHSLGSVAATRRPQFFYFATRGEI